MSEPAEVPVHEVMSKRVVTIKTTETLSDALDRFRLTGLRHLVVIDEDRRRARVWSRTVPSRRSGRAWRSAGWSAESGSRPASGPSRGPPRGRRQVSLLAGCWTQGGRLAGGRWERRGRRHRDRVRICCAYSPRVSRTSRRGIGDDPVPGQVEYIVGLAITAPSVLNTQPWRFFAHDDAIDVFAVPSRGLPVVDPTAREAYISCGAAVFNLRLGIGGLVGRRWSGCCRTREPGACRQRAHRRPDDAPGRRASSVRRHVPPAHQPRTVLG